MGFFYASMMNMFVMGFDFFIDLQSCFQRKNKFSTEFFGFRSLLFVVSCFLSFSVEVCRFFKRFSVMISQTLEIPIQLVNMLFPDDSSGLILCLDCIFVLAKMGFFLIICSSEVSFDLFGYSDFVTNRIHNPEYMLFILVLVGRILLFSF